MNLSELAILLGLINGLILIVRPIGRIHSRIDRLEFQQEDQAQDIAKILGASGITPRRREVKPVVPRRWFR